MFERYTERARQTLFCARDEAVQRGSASIETEHVLLGLMRDADFARTYQHPEQPGRSIPLSEVLAMYAWHSRHHVAHITRLRERMGW